MNNVVQLTIKKYMRNNFRRNNDYDFKAVLLEIFE